MYLPEQPKWEPAPEELWTVELVVGRQEEPPTVEVKAAAAKNLCNVIIILYVHATNLEGNMYMYVHNLCWRSRGSDGRRCCCCGGCRCRLFRGDCGGCFCRRCRSSVSLCPLYRKLNFSTEIMIKSLFNDKIVLAFLKPPLKNHQMVVNMNRRSST